MKLSVHAPVVDEIRASTQAYALAPHFLTRQDFPPEEDDLSAGRSIMRGVGAGLVLWCIIGALLYWLL